MKSRVIFKSSHYTACAMKDGSLIVTNRKGIGRRLIGAFSPYWIESIETAIDAKEAHVLCRAMFQS